MDIINSYAAHGAPTGTGNDTFVHSGIDRAAGEGFVITIYYMNTLGTPPSDITSVVWDAAGDNQAFTLLQSWSMLDGAHRSCAMYYLAAPTSAKTSDITVTFAGSANDAVITSIEKTSSTFTVATGASIKTGRGSAPGTTYTDNVPSAVGDLCLGFAVFPAVAGGVSPTGSGVSLLQYSASTASLDAIASAKKQATTTSTAFGWFVDPSITSTLGLVTFEVSLTPAGGGGGGPVTTTLNATETGADTFSATLNATGSVNLTMNAAESGSDAFDATVSVASSMGTITIPTFFQLETHGDRVGETGFIADFYNPATGAQVLRKTGLSSNVVSDALLVPGTIYNTVITLSDGSIGIWPLQAA